jgi:hypothetical protein
MLLIIIQFYIGAGLEERTQGIRIASWAISVPSPKRGILHVDECMWFTVLDIAWHPSAQGSPRFQGWYRPGWKYRTLRDVGTVPTRSAPPPVVLTGNSAFSAFGTGGLQSFPRWFL